MARWTFPATAHQTYRGDNTSLLDGAARQGQSTYAPDGMMKSLVLFDYRAIRSTLANRIVDRVWFDYTVYSWHYSRGGTAVIGTHKFTALPAKFDGGIWAERWRKFSTTGQRVTDLDLGTGFGAELKNGNSTGLVFGPAPNTSYEYTGGVTGANQGAQSPVLIIDTRDEVLAPFDPELNNPRPRQLLDAFNYPTQFTWTPSDPLGIRPIAAALRIKKPNGSYVYWDGTNFISSHASINYSTITNHTIIVPPGKIQNGFDYTWSVQTRNADGGWGPWADERTFLAYTPPNCVITEPASGASVNVPRPRVAWEYVHPNNLPQTAWVAKVFKKSVTEQSGFDPDTSKSFVWMMTKPGADKSVLLDVDLDNRQAYRAYVQVMSAPTSAEVGTTQKSAFVFSDFTVDVAPYAPKMTTPTNGSVADLAKGFTLAWQNNLYGSGAQQTAFAIRRQSGTAAYQWWSGAAWVAEETFIAGDATTYSFRQGDNTNGSNYTFSVAVRDNYGSTSPYATGTTVTGSTAASVSVTAPGNYVTQASPTVAWAVFDPENDPQQSYQVRILPRSSYIVNGMNPATATAVWDSGVVNDPRTRNVAVPVSLTNQSFFRAYVRVKTGGLLSEWAYAEFQITLSLPATPIANVVALSDSGSVEIFVQGRDSILDENTARGVDGWAPLTNGSIVGYPAYTTSRTGFQLRFSSVAAGDVTLRTATKYPVAPNTVYTGAASLINVPNGPARDGFVAIEFLDGNDSVILTVPGTVVNDGVANRSEATAESPGNAVNARLRVSIFGTTAANELHNFFEPVLRPGGGGNEWSPGGLAGKTSISVIDSLTGRIVRRGLNIPMPKTSQQVRLYDEEVPVGVPQEYEITTRVEYGGQVLTSSSLVMAPVAWESGWLWLSDPLRPGSGRAFGPQSFEPTTRPVRQGIFRPIGRADAVVTTGVRALREGGFTVVTWSKYEREEYLKLVNSSDTVLMRIPPDQGEMAGETIYVKLTGDAPEERALQSRTPHRIIKQTWIEQRRPLTNLEYGVDV